MRLLKLLALVLTLTTYTATVLADEPSPAEIFDKVESAYKSMSTFEANGYVVSDIETDGRVLKTKSSFSIALKKPNQYLISWEQKNFPVPGVHQSGCVWSDGSQPYLFMSGLGYSKMKTDEVALGAATGISGGVAFTVPSLFLPAVAKTHEYLSRLKELKLIKEEKIQDDDCYVLSGPSPISKEETFWISKSSSLIRKYSRSLEAPEGGIEMPKMTDEQLEESIKSLGWEVTEESKQKMKEMMEQSEAMLATTQLKGTSTEIYDAISSPDLTKADFQFDPPQGAIEKESLFPMDLQLPATPNEPN